MCRQRLRDEAAAYAAHAAQLGFHPGAERRLGAVAREFFTSAARRIRSAAATAADAAGLVAVLGRRGVLTLPTGGGETAVAAAALAAEVATECNTLLAASEAEEREALGAQLVSGGARGKRPRDDSSGSQGAHDRLQTTVCVAHTDARCVPGWLWGLGLSEALETDITKSFAPQEVRLVVPPSADHQYAEIAANMLKTLATSLVWVDSPAGTTDASGGGGGEAKRLRVQPQRAREAAGWCALLGGGTLSLLCHAVDVAAATATEAGGAEEGERAEAAACVPAACVLQGAAGGAASLSLSAALICRYLRFRHPSLQRLAIVLGVSAGSASATLAATRRIFKDFAAGESQPLVVTVLLEGGAVSAESSDGRGWKEAVFDGRRVSIRAEVVAALREYAPQMMVVGCADEGWLPASSFLLDDLGSSRAGAGAGAGAEAWAVSQPPSRVWLPLLAELAALPWPTLALFGTPHACRHSKSPGFASIQSQVFCFGLAAARRVGESAARGVKRARAEDSAAAERLKVEKIVGKRHGRHETAGNSAVEEEGEGEAEYLVVWSGRSHSEATWEQAAGIEATCGALVRAYEGALEAKKQAAEQREREEQCAPQRRTRSDFADVVQVSPLS